MKVRGMPTQVLGKPGQVRPVEFEYLVVTAEAESPDLLAAYGAQGWELVAAVREAGARVTFYFKRRKS